VRRLLAALAMLATLSLAATPCGARSATQRVAGRANTGLPNVAIDETTATAAIKLSGRAFVNATNDIWGGNPVTRPNQSRVVRIYGYDARALTFTGISTLAGAGYFAVVVDGVLFASPQITQDALPHEVFVGGIAAGSHTIEIWEGEQQHQGNLDIGADQPIAGTYVVSVTVRSGTLARATASHGVVVTGESQAIGDATRPWQWYGWGGQFRAAAEAQGWLVAYFAYGSRTVAGDGLTPAQTAQAIHDLWAAMGSTAKYLLIYQRQNDYAYWSQSGSVHTTPAQLATFWSSTLDALAVTDTFTVNLISSFLSLPNDATPSGLYSKADYDTAVNGVAVGRAYVTLRNSSAFNLVLPTDYTDNVHLAQSGHNKVAPVVQSWYGF
jgi:hypothetical protein